MYITDKWFPQQKIMIKKKVAILTWGGISISTVVQALSTWLDRTYIWTFSHGILIGFSIRMQGAWDFEMNKSYSNQKTWAASGGQKHEKKSFNKSICHKNERCTLL